MREYREEWFYAFPVGVGTASKQAHSTITQTQFPLLQVEKAGIVYIKHYLAQGHSSEAPCEDRIHYGNIALEM